MYLDNIFPALCVEVVVAKVSLVYFSGLGYFLVSDDRSGQPSLDQVLQSEKHSLLKLAASTLEV